MLFSKLADIFISMYVTLVTGTKLLLAEHRNHYQKAKSQCLSKCIHYCFHS